MRWALPSHQAGAESAVRPAAPAAAPATAARAAAVAAGMGDGVDDEVAHLGGWQVQSGDKAHDLLVYLVRGQARHHRRRGAAGGDPAFGPLQLVGVAVQPLAQG